MLQSSMPRQGSFTDKQNLSMDADADDGDKKQKKNSKSRRRRTRNNVIITIYVESTTIRQQKPRRRYLNKKTLQWKPPTSAPGYDRKAQLLAYSQQLRSKSSQKNRGFNKNKWNLKNKRWKPSLSTLIMRIRRLFLRFRRPWRYDRIVEAQPRKSSPHRGWRHVLVELSCCLRCNKG